MKPLIYRGYKPNIWRAKLFNKWMWCCSGKGLDAYGSTAYEAYARWHSDTYWHYHNGMEA